MIYEHLSHFARDIPPEGSILGLDYGAARIGIAVSDSTRIIASPREIYARRNISKDIGHISRIGREAGAVAIVVGLPLELDGSEGENCARVREFTSKLEKKLELPILFYDERFSTSAVTRSMKDAGVSRKNRQASDDKLAAGYILQCVLDAL